MYDYAWWALFGLIHSKIYVLKCPVCVYAERVRKDHISWFREP